MSLFISATLEIMDSTLARPSQTMVSSLLSPPVRWMLNFNLTVMVKVILFRDSKTMYSTLILVIIILPFPSLSTYMKLMETDTVSVLLIIDWNYGVVILEVYT